jgi:hypothetical protein
MVERSNEIFDRSPRHHHELDPERLAGGLQRLSGWAVRRGRGTDEHADPRGPRHDLPENLQLLGDEIGLNEGQPGDVAAGPRQARHVPDADRVGMRGEHDRDRRGRLARGLHLARGRRQDDIDVHAHELGRQGG